ncbi:MAG TPA: hypothetical protein VGC60_00775, partial [Pyrinomonadaceae bacterium]
MANKWLKLFPAAKRSKADVLIDGEEYFLAIIAAIETAKTPHDYIYILGWMLDISFELSPGKTLFTLLEKAAKSGVEIRILIWDNFDPNYLKLNADAVRKLSTLPGPVNLSVFLDGHTFSTAKSKKFVLEVVSKGITLLNALQKTFFVVDSEVKRDLAGLVTKLTPFLSSPTIGTHHEKVVIVKSKNVLTAFCGGIDFNKNRVISEIKGKEYRFPYYHDTACRLQGPAAYEVLQKFKMRWRNHPQAKSVILLGEKEPQPKDCPSPSPYAKVVGTYNSPNGSEPPVRSLKHAYVKIIDNAKSYIYIEDQYMVNLEVASALKKKVQDENFKMVTFAIQAESETQDILIPLRKRIKFLLGFMDGMTSAQQAKVCVA